MSTPVKPFFQTQCADARDEGAYKKLLGPRRADLLLSDPPYCLLTRRRKGGDLRESKGRKLDHDVVVRFENVRAYKDFTAQWLPLAIAHLKPSAPVILWTNFLGKEPLLSAAKSCGYGYLWGEFVWAKRTREGRGNEELLRVYEVALVLQTHPLPASSPEDAPRSWSVVAGYDDEGQGSALGAHPHHKPFGVLEPLLRAYSRPGGLVLDPFAGSGSIPAAALKLERDAACLEREPEWAQRVQARLSSSKS
jgi:site-specific DNA-methyltransferase (adenine-specific)